jgi:site-specific recombinase XerD
VSKEFIDFLNTIERKSEYVISGDSGSPRTPNSYAVEFKKFMEQMETDISVKALEPHELRHTYGTLLREKGIDIYTIQKVMGHSDISITAKICAQ